MKAFWIGVFSSFIVSIFMVIGGVYLSKPVFLYQINEDGSDVRFAIKNVGLMAADRVRFKLVLANAIQDTPVIRRQYWVRTVDIESYYKIESIPDSYRVIFDDDGKLGAFSRGEELRILLVPENPSGLNSVKGHDIHLSRSIEGMVVLVDDMDSVTQAIHFAAFILFLFSFAYLALGYQYAKSKRSNWHN